MQDKAILYKAKVDKFLKRILIVSYPYVIIPFIFLFIPFLNQNFNNPIAFIWVVIMLSIIIMMLMNSYKWTTNQIKSLTFYDNLFEIETVTKNKIRVYKIDKGNIRTRLEWKGGRPRILKLTLFNNENKVIDFYSGGKSKMEYALEEIVYKMNKNNTPAANTNGAKIG